MAREAGELHTIYRTTLHKEELCDPKSQRRWGSRNGSTATTWRPSEELRSVPRVGADSACGGDGERPLVVSLAVRGWRRNGTGGAGPVACSSAGWAGSYGAARSLSASLNSTRLNITSTVYKGMRNSSVSARQVRLERASARPAPGRPAPAVSASALGAEAPRTGGPGARLRSPRGAPPARRPHFLRAPFRDLPRLPQRHSY